MASLPHEPACNCAALLTAKPLGRRRILGLALATLGATLGADLANAAAKKKSFEATLLNCIDPRFVESARHFMVGRHWINSYSQFTFAGAAIGAVAPKFESWHQTYWDNLAVTIQLHQVKTLVALDHRDCGAARLAYGDAAVDTRAAETETHRKALAEFRAQAGKLHPELRIITGLIDINGKVELLG